MASRAGCRYAMLRRGNRKLIFYLEYRRILRPGLSVIEHPGRADVGVPEPLLIPFRILASILYDRVAES